MNFCWSDIAKAAVQLLTAVTTDLDPDDLTRKRI